MDDNMEQDYGLVILELMQALKEKIALILAAVVLAAGLGWAVSSFVLPKKYEASVNMIVNARTELSGVVTSDSISSAENLVDTYAIIIKSNKVLNQVIERLQLTMTFEDLYEMVSVNGINHTQVMKIAAQCADPKLAMDIVQTISEIAPAIVADAVEAGSCKVVSEVYAKPNPVSPNISRNTLMAAVAALMLTCAAIVLKELLNDYIINDMDMETKLGLSVLGVIPDVEV